MFHAGRVDWLLVSWGIVVVLLCMVMRYVATVVPFHRILFSRTGQSLRNGVRRYVGSAERYSKFEHLFHITSCAPVNSVRRLETGWFFVYRSLMNGSISVTDSNISKNGSSSKEDACSLMKGSTGSLSWHIRILSSLCALPLCVRFMVSCVCGTYHPMSSALPESFTRPWRSASGSVITFETLERSHNTSDALEMVEVIDMTRLHELLDTYPDST